MIGYSKGNEIRSDSASGMVNGSDSVGGLIGYSLEDEVSDSNASGNVIGQINVGCLIGNAASGTITNNRATGQINDEGAKQLSGTVGGLIGKSSGTRSGIIPLRGSFTETPTLEA